MVQEQPVRVGRRLAAILAADVAGYSRLMGLDEVGTARTLREHRTVTDALVAEHGGRIVKTTGDGVLLEFSSVVDAVECAVAVQTVMSERNVDVPQDRRMLLRIGINLGDILTEGEDILGDGVNIAARLEGIAEPGGIFISSSAYDQVRGKVAVEFVDLGEQELKNISRAVRVYAVVNTARAPDMTGATITIPSLIKKAFSPFPGLHAFGTEDAKIFFGRKRETENLIRALREGARFVLIEGASGSGKSSLVGAGLIPRLAEGAIEGSRNWVLPESRRERNAGVERWSTRWAGLRFTPAERGEDPFLSLAAQLLPLLERDYLDARQLAAQLSLSVCEARRKLVDVLDGRSETAELLIFVDQFEELFMLVPDHEKRTRFIAMLVNAAACDRIRIVATIRADFSHMITQEHRELVELLQIPWAVYKLPAPGPDSLAEMIDGPAKVVGVEFESGLRSKLLTDTGDSAGRLPLLAFALARLYRERKGHLLTNEVYKDMRGVTGAIGAEAEAVFGGLSQKSKECLAQIFHRLVEVDDRRVATRKRANREALNFSEEARAFVGAFERVRLLIVDQGDGGESVVEVAHEALFKEWTALRNWIEKRTEDLFLKRQVGVDSIIWAKNGRCDQDLWQYEDLGKLGEALERLEILPERDLDLSIREFIVPNPGKLLEMIESPETSPAKRAWVGDRLDQVGDPRPGVGCHDGLPDIVWCPIPRGQVSLEGEAGLFDVSPFDISRYPVTYRQYSAFIDAPDGYFADEWWTDLERRSEPGTQFCPRGNHPAETLSWHDAMAFTRWLSQRLNEEIRLPTEWEWQQAATSGKPKFQYPWGPFWVEGRANTDESRIGLTTSVGTFPEGRSEQGVFDLSGNVLEWCLNEFNDAKLVTPTGSAWRVVRGGACLFDQSNASGTSREHFFRPNLRSLVIGFRLVRVYSKP